jgi:hypothetical protein
MGLANFRDTPNPPMYLKDGWPPRQQATGDTQKTFGTNLFFAIIYRHITRSRRGHEAMGGCAEFGLQF